MKKMLFICMVGSLFFLTSVATASEAGEVVSTNIVGYLTKSNSTGFTHLTPNFIDVCSEIQSFKLNRLTGNFSDDDKIIFYSVSGKPGETLVRVQGWGGSWVDGWYDDGYTAPVEDITDIKAGTSFIVWTSSATDITVSGQVDDNDAEFNLLSGFNSIGNRTHINLALDKFIFSGLQDDDKVILYNSSGKPAETLVRVQGWGGSWADGWYDDGYTAPIGATTIIKPSDGFFLYTTGTKVSVKIPNNDGDI